MSDGKPIILRSGDVKVSHKLLLEMISEVNPEVEQAVLKARREINLTFGKPKRNLIPNSVMKYNTIIEVFGDGCLFSSEHKDRIIFCYGRWDVGRLAFKETGTIGVPDVPVNVEANTEDGLKKYFYNIIEEFEFVRDVKEYPGVKEWRGKVPEDHLSAIFTRWENGKRVYYDSFTVFSKKYNPDSTFEDSDFVG